MDEYFKVGNKIMGNSITVNDFHIYGFASLTGDFNPLHVDDEIAKETAFRGRIGHGLLSLSLGLGLISEYVKGYFLYGFDKIRFLNPIRPGKTIHSELTIIDKKEKENYDLYYCKMEVFDNEKKEILISEIIFGRMKQDE
ncbi:MAG: MaoC family dehydratase [Candidatus Nanopusillus acidilobi]|jgi:acyl dehydratase